MSASTTPGQYNELEDAYITDANFKVDISQKMKVPNKISFNNDAVNGIGGGNWYENINMQVPERILVIGRDQHVVFAMSRNDHFIGIVPQGTYFDLKPNKDLDCVFGTRAPPREIVFDNSLLQQNEHYPSDPRVGTPPRTLTLDKYPFPGIEEFEEPVKEHIPVAKMKHITPYKGDETLNDSRIMNRESTPPIGNNVDGLTPAEEIVHLRRQMAKLNRRVMALELENLSRLQKEKILYGLGIAYFLLKAIVWLNRNY